MTIAASFIIPTALIFAYLALVLFYSDVALGERGFTLGGLVFGFSFSVIAYGAQQIQPGLGFVAQVLATVSFLLGLASAVYGGGRYLWAKALTLCLTWLGSWWVLSLAPFGGAAL